MIDRFKSRDEAAQYLSDCLGLRVAKSTLQKWATTGGGPVYRRFGKRAVYRQEDLDTWAQEKLSAPRHSTTSA